jgi:hypothetical protein
VAAPTAATPPAAVVAASKSRRLLRSTLSVMTSHPFFFMNKTHITRRQSIWIRADQNLKILICMPAVPTTAPQKSKQNYSQNPDCIWKNPTVL